MAFNFINREPLHSDRFWKFTDDNGRSTCEAAHFSLFTKDGVWDIPTTSFVFGPVFTTAIGNELHELKQALLNAWGGTKFNSSLFAEWLSTNGIGTDSSMYWNCYAETDIAMYVIAIQVDNYYSPTYAQVGVTAFNRDFVTDNAAASRLIAACRDVSHPGYLGELAFAKAVCEDLYAELADAPAVKKRLQASILRLSKMLEV